MGIGNASNELGKLFVDIGIGGVGKALKSLNSISASFLLTKNAAMQVVGSVVNFGKEAMNTAVDYAKLNASMGVSLETIQKLSAYLNKYDLGDGLISSLGGIMDMLNRVNEGSGAIDANFVTGLQRLGLNWQKYRGGTFEDMLNLVTDIQEAMRGLDAETARLRLQDLKLPTDLLYAFQQGDFDISRGVVMSDEENKSTVKGKQILNELGRNLKQAGYSLIGKEFLRSQQDVSDIKSAIQGDKDATKQVLKNYAKNITPFGATSGITKGTAESVKQILNQGYPDILNVGEPKVNDNLKSSSGEVKISVENQNNIYGNNADEIAEKIAGITKEDIVNAENNAFQISNIAGA